MVTGIRKRLVDEESSTYLFNNDGETHLHLIGSRELSALRKLDPIEQKLPEGTVHLHTLIWHAKDLFDSAIFFIILSC